MTSVLRERRGFCEENMFEVDPEAWYFFFLTKLKIEMGRKNSLPQGGTSRWESGFVTLVAQMVKKLPAVQHIRVISLGREDPLEKGMVTHSSILAQRTPWTEEPDRLQSIHGFAKSWTQLSN